VQKTFYQQEKRPEPIPSDRQTVNSCVTATYSRPSPIDIHTSALMRRITQIEREWFDAHEKHDYQLMAMCTEAKLKAIRSEFEAFGREVGR